MAIEGDVLSLVQANNGDILAGTNYQARIYRSSDNGQNWTQVVSLGSTSGVTSMVKDVSGNLFASVIVGPSSQGIWRSTNHGATWTRVYSNPANAGGYTDISVIRPTNRIIAVGYGGAVKGNIVFSLDGGTTWGLQDPRTDYLGRLVGRVASSEVGHRAWLFFGDENNTITEAASVPGEVGPIYTRSQISGGGLDIALFGLRDLSGRILERKIIAIKNGSNTEIWQHEYQDIFDGTFNLKWVKISTIPSVQFNALYVDRTPDQTALQRTIWAGADGEIWVSYNSGLTWAVATTAPTGQMYSFLRTSSGVLIAGGQNGEIFLFSSGGSEGGGDPGSGGGDPGGGGTEPPPEEPEPPTLPGTTVPATSRFLGRTATCTNEVYVGNKFSFSNVTHILYYNGSSYTNLQFTTNPPYDIVGNPTAVNRAIYFGSLTTDTNVPGGPFSSLVFDLTRAAQGLTIAWEYWNGSTWVSLPGHDGTAQFTVAGVNSVHWHPPSNWAVTTVDSIGGYWIRARVTAVAAGAITPIQGNRYIYTVLLPYVEIAENEIQGEIPAIGKITWQNRADNEASSLAMEIDRSVCGLRSLSRGLNFNAYINISDVQNLFGISFALGTEAAWQTDVDAPTGRSLVVSHSAPNINAWKDIVTITLSNTIARDYYGTFRAFIRCYRNTAATTWQIRLRTTFGSGGGSADSRVVFPVAAADWHVADLGQISIPTTQISHHTGNLGDRLSLTIQGKSSVASNQLIIYDLILIPVDEWAIDARPPQVAASMTSQVKSNNYLDIDSISNPKASLTVFNRNEASHIVGRYQALNNGPVILQRGTAQRIWFLNMATTGSYWYSYPSFAGTVQVYKQQRYLGMRGDS